MMMTMIIGTRLCSNGDTFPCYDVTPQVRADISNKCMFSKIYTKSDAIKDIIVNMLNLFWQNMYATCSFIKNSLGTRRRTYLVK